MYSFAYSTHLPFRFAFESRFFFTVCLSHWHIFYIQYPTYYICIIHVHTSFSEFRFWPLLSARLAFYTLSFLFCLYTLLYTRAFLFCCLSISLLVVVLFTVHCKMDSSPIVTTHTNNKSKSSRKSYTSPTFVAVFFLFIRNLTFWFSANKWRI